MLNEDPLAVIAQEAPTIPDAEAIGIARTHYGLEVSVKPLVSERDQNFRLRVADGRQFVLKIANAAEDRVVTDFQVQALRHIARRIREEGIPVTVPEIVPTVDGDASFLYPIDGVEHVVRTVTFIAGQPLSVKLPSPALARHSGESLAHLGRALRGFEHPASRHSLLWDIQQALGLRSLVQYVREEGAAEAVRGALDDYEQHAAPALPGLRAQVIHNDLNPDNLLVGTDDPERVAGIIDFGDMLHAPLVADVAIGCSYLRVPSGDPLALMAEFVAGYQSVTPLEQSEIDVLFELIQARISASITILAWRASMRGEDDPYLARQAGADRSTGEFLVALREVPRDHAVQVFRQVCASVAASD